MLLLQISLCVYADETDSIAGILDKVVEQSSPVDDVIGGAWNNPSLILLLDSYSLSSVEVQYDGGNSERYGRLEASTYLKMGKLTLQGTAGYDNGALHNVTDCENADPGIVYPYWTFDEVGGNMNLERYEFGGAVCVELEHGWNVGVSGHYHAGLYYRKRDPRTRNVSGILDIAVGGSRRVGKYLIGLSGSYRRYKQSCDIDFKSELGASKIYHLTGPGTHYERFAGLGTDSYYTGNQWGASVSLLPDPAGVYVHAGGETERLKHVLTDLNKLPMARIERCAGNVEAGYSSEEWAVTAFCAAERRHGFENIFGDAVSGQYPQIGSLLMHIVNWQSAGLRGAWCREFGRVTLSAWVDAGYTHWKEQHREPRLTGGGNCWHARSSLKSMWRVSQDVLVMTEAGYGRRSSGSLNMALATAGCDYSLKNRKYSVGLRAGWTYDDEHRINAAFSFKF